MWFFNKRKNRPTKEDDDSRKSSSRARDAFVPDEQAGLSQSQFTRPQASTRKALPEGSSRDSAIDRPRSHEATQQSLQRRARPETVEREVERVEGDAAPRPFPWFALGAVAV